jgi:hypothetical protein
VISRGHNRHGYRERAVKRVTLRTGNPIRPREWRSARSAPISRLLARHGLRYLIGVGPATGPRHHRSSQSARHFAAASSGRFVSPRPVTLGNSRARPRRSSPVHEQLFFDGRNMIRVGERRPVGERCPKGHLVAGKCRASAKIRNRIVGVGEKHQLRRLAPDRLERKGPSPGAPIFG